MRASSTITARSGVATAPAAARASSRAARRACAPRTATTTSTTLSRSPSTKPKQSLLVVASSSSSPSPPATTSSSSKPVRVLEMGSASVLGTSRKKNEDRLKISTTTAPFSLYAGVFDGHGGSAVSEWLTENLASYLVRRWPPSKGGSGSGGTGPASSTVEGALTDAFLAADRKLLQAKAGFFGVGERGVGGSKCGSTAALVVLFPEADGSTSLAAANVGDARAVLCRSGKAVQLTTDHVPDSEEERLRIERLNPNPKLPLVRFVGGTWRVGGLLALSRAFGDSFMKGTGQFEGLKSGVGTSYESGFGVTAEPDVTVTGLGAGDEWLIISSDGLLINVERGGGGGLTNEQACAIAQACGDADEAARALVAAAVEAGSTDDVTVVVFKLGA